MVENQKQMRFSTKELSLIKNTFGENEKVLISLRKHFLQLEMDDAELSVFNKVIDDDIIALLRNLFLPTVESSAEAPIHQVADLWIQTAVEIKQYNPEQAQYLIEAREIMVNYIDDRLKALENDQAGYKLKDYSWGDEFEPGDRYIHLLAWNDIIGFVEAMLNQIKILAEKVNEEEIKERMNANSNK
jgi:hypothetical protein